uniref:GpcrRhopsn4 domain-containing protein n=1 Tax=Syphacia muris TaxID=451379 RepID=A0A0N5ARR5_9BILA
MLQLWKLLLIVLTVYPLVDALHVTGQCSTSGNHFQIIAKFGFQQFHHLDKEHSQGFIFGNVTSLNNKIGLIVFFIFYMCLLMNKTLLETRCFPNGTDDIMRWIPCASGKTCINAPNQTIPGYQMALRMRQLDAPQYYYVVLLGCTLNENCSWVSVQENINVEYNLWLTNGNPMSTNKDFFSYQFSFDEQDTVVIYFVALIMYLTLSIFEWKAVINGKQVKKLYSNQKLLCLILSAKIIGLSLHLLNIVVFAYDGRGLLVARFLGEFLRLFATCVLYLLLILLSRGWLINDTGRSAINRTVIIIWIFLTFFHYFFFFANFFFVVDILHDIDIFKSWPGYGMLLIRMCQAIWFLTEIRYTIVRERDEEKAVFIAYFGAGFLVWFVYLSLLGVIVSFISVLWRFKVILAITTFANFVAISSLVHLFWPTGSYSRFFLFGNSLHRRLDSLNSTELRDMEYLLQDTDSDVDSIVLNIHAI